jgi:hypothetical protein
MVNEMAMRFEGETFRRAMMYWDLLQKYGSIMEPKRRQECMDLYEFYKARAIERETEMSEKIERNREHVRVYLASQSNSTDEFISALLSR